MHSLDALEGTVEDTMHDVILHSNWDSFLVGIPFLIMLLIGFFRLDELFAAPKQRARKARRASGMDAEGQIILSDPDGRRWQPRKLR